MAYTGVTDTWQAEAETNRVRQYGIAVGTELWAPDVSEIPLGGRIDWTANSSGEEADGFERIAVYFTEDDIDITPVDEAGVEINPATAPGLIAIIRDKVGIRSINFTSQEVGAKLLQYATNMIEVNITTGVAEPGSGAWIETQEHSRVSLAIEISGIGILLMPSVEIKALPPSTGVKKAATQEVQVDVFARTMPHYTTPRAVTYVFLEYKAV